MTGILFDLDGTLLNTLDDLLNATNHVLAKFGYPERTLAELRRAVGNGAAHQFRSCLPPGTPEERVQELLEYYLPYYAQHCDILTAPYPGIPQALEALGKDYALGIVSNKPDRAAKALCARHFPGVYALGEVPGCPRKPAPDMITKALATIGADRGIYVGDSEVDIRTGKAAGLPCVSVTWGFRDEPELVAAGAECLCRSAVELVDCIHRIEETYGQ